MGILMWVGRRSAGAAVIALVLVAVAGVTVLADYLDASASIEVLRLRFFVVVQIGVGLYVTAAGTVVWTVGAVSGYLAGRAMTDRDVAVPREVEVIVGEPA